MTSQSAVALDSVRQRLAECDRDGLVETSRLLRLLQAALEGEQPLDEVGIVAAMATSLERLERGLVAVELGA
ncbi:hypothetical protein QE430_002455 [Microbacterium testaceum]|nr:hypothetical protein [Microbacterium testaceum]